MKGEELRRMRRILGYSRTELGRLMGYKNAYAAIRRLEVGERPITIRFRKQLLNLPDKPRTVI